MKYGAIVLAAGSGSRFKGKKQDILFHDKPLWRYSYDTARDVVGDDYIVAVGKDVQGGSTRSESVIIGLRALPDDTERVVILDAARPMVSKQQVNEILSNASPSVSFVRPLVNTPIYRDGRYLNRNELYDLLVPQAFDYQMLQKAYASGRFGDMTDETRVMYEYYDIKPTLLEAENNLFKVTYPGDLQIIESIYQSQIECGERL